MSDVKQRVTHTPGPWCLNEDGSILIIHFSLPDGRNSGVAVSIGSTALQFRAPRQGSHRGEKMVYRPFAETDRANASLIAAAPDLLAACKRIVENLSEDVSDTVAEAWDEARLAIAKAEGR